MLLSVCKIKVNRVLFFTSSDGGCYGLCGLGLLCVCVSFPPVVPCPSAGVALGMSADSSLNACATMLSCSVIIFLPI